MVRSLTLSLKLFERALNLFLSLPFRSLGPRVAVYPHSASREPVFHLLSCSANLVQRAAQKVRRAVALNSVFRRMRLYNIKDTPLTDSNYC
jgi:hypothetical protein